MGRLSGDDWKDGYPGEVYDAFLDEVAQGKPVKVVCRMEGMPHYTGIYQKCRADEAFKRRLRDAQEWQARFWLEDVAERLADIRDGHIEAKSAAAWMNATKMVVEKLAPREYGVKTAIDHTSGGEKIKSFGDMYGVAEPESS